VRACKYSAAVSEGFGRRARLAYYRDKCVDCGACADVCYYGALVMSGKEMTVGEVMDEVLQDANYYKNSGGGVTLSGGEATVQPDFALGILEACKQAGIHTAIETNMLADWAVYERFIPVLDLVMLDIKLSDSGESKKWTGVGNEKILENIQQISKRLPIIVRTPVVPGANDSPEEIGRIAEIVRNLDNVLYFELLLFNPLGESKYQALDMENAFVGQRPQDSEKKAALLAAAQKCGKEVRVG
ncbi:MAG: glycyl-radical enzyme activating protein, partial [Oscillospiraceae bacterium]|nr:glycyl-radical enzyme activating protein [Oscillospiraceae bacterium]